MFESRRARCGLRLCGHVDLGAAAQSLRNGWHIRGPQERPQPEPWQTDVPGPFLTIGEVGAFALGDDRFRITSPGGEREVEVEGFEQAGRLAHELTS